MNDLQIQAKIQPVFPESEVQNSSAKPEVDFVEVMKDAISRTNRKRNEADESIEKLMLGETGIHETMIAVSKADISTRLLLQFRNKAMESYKEIMRMSF